MAFPTQSDSLIHRLKSARILQVLGVYAAACFGVIQVVDIFINRFGLPDWFFPGTIVLMIVGLPIILTTAFLHAPQSSAGNKVRADAQMGSAAQHEYFATNPNGTSALPSIQPSYRLRNLLTWKRAF